MSEYVVDFKNAERVSHFESLFADFTAPIHEEIVRCRDCKHYNEKTYEWVNNWTRTDTTCALFDGCRVEADGFCKWASRKVVGE